MVVDRWGKLKTTYATRNRSPRPQFRCIPTFTRLALHMVAASSSEYRQTLQIEAGTRTHLSLGSLNFDLCLAWFWAKINIIPRFPGFTRRTKFGDSRFDSFFFIMLIKDYTHSDLSAAFDTVDHSTLLNLLQSRFSVSGRCLAWFQSYLSGGIQVFITSTSQSAPVPLVTGVPQGSVFGPIQFIAYTTDISDTFTGHNLLYHMFADDTQMY